AHAVFDRSSPQPASPTAPFMPKRAAEQIENLGVNLGRRSPASWGHFSTPDHMRVRCLMHPIGGGDQPSDSALGQSQPIAARLADGRYLRSPDGWSPLRRERINSPGPPLRSSLR